MRRARTTSAVVIAATPTTAVVAPRSAAAVAPAAVARAGPAAKGSIGFMHSCSAAGRASSASSAVNDVWTECRQVDTCMRAQT